MNLENINVSKELKIIYMGTPDFSATVLEGLLSQYKVRAIVSQPDRPVGRNGEVRFTAVKEVANKHTILVLQPEKIKDNYGYPHCVFADCNEQTLINTFRGELMRQNLNIPVLDSIKSPINERIKIILRLLNTDRISFIQDETKSIVEALQTALYDEKCDIDKWKDDFTSDIDSIDAFCYSFEKWIPQLARYGEK